MSNALRIGNRSISYEQAKEMLFPELIPQKGLLTLTNRAIQSKLRAQVRNFKKFSISEVVL